jgi:hypothetical protein
MKRALVGCSFTEKTKDHSSTISQSAPECCTDCNRDSSSNNAVSAEHSTRYVGYVHTAALATTGAIHPA